MEKENEPSLLHRHNTETKGVGLVIKTDIKHVVLEIVGESEKITVLKLTTKGSPITIVQVYAPTEVSSEEEVEDFYTKLEATLDSFKSPMNLIIGDFNRKVGPRNHGDEEAVGPYGYGIRNERRNSLIQFAHEFRLKTINTFSSEES